MHDLRGFYAANLALSVFFYTFASARPAEGIESTFNDAAKKVQQEGTDVEGLNVTKGFLAALAKNHKKFLYFPGPGLCVEKLDEGKLYKVFYGRYKGRDSFSEDGFEEGEPLVLEVYDKGNGDEYELKDGDLDGRVDLAPLPKSKKPARKTKNEALSDNTQEEQQRQYEKGLALLIEHTKSEEGTRCQGSNISSP